MEDIEDIENLEPWKEKKDNGGYPRLYLREIR